MPISQDVIEKLIQQNNDLKDRVSRLETQAQFPQSWGDHIGRYLAIPNLRGFWPLNSLNEAASAMDYSGQSRILSNVGASGVIYNGRIQYLDFDGVGDYLARGDEAGTSITGHICFGGWFWADVASTHMGMMGKWNGPGVQRSYLMFRVNTNVVRVHVTNSVATIGVSVDSALFTTNTWHHVVARFTPSTELSLFVDGVKTVNTTSIPASIADSTAPFELARYDAGAQYFNGRISMCFLSAAGQENMPDSLIKELYEAGLPFYS